MPVYEVREAAESDGPIEEDTILTAEVTAVYEQEKTNKTTEEKYKRLQWKFTVNDPESAFDGRNLYGDTGVDFVAHVGCKPWNWSQEIMATDLPKGYNVDTEVLVGMECRIQVGARDYKDKQTGDDRVYNFVKDVMRSRDHMSMTAETF